MWDNKFVISNLSKDSKMSVSALGNELKDSKYLNYIVQKKKSRHLDYNLKKHFLSLKHLKVMHIYPI